jgi:hypothetical protein
MDVIGFLCVSLGSSTVQFHETLGSRDACACSEAGFSSKNGDCAEKYPTEEQRSVLRLLCAKGLNAKYIHNEMFPFYGGKCLSCKAVHNWAANVSLMTRRLKRRCGSGWDNSQKDFYAMDSWRCGRGILKTLHWHSPGMITIYDITAEIRTLIYRIQVGSHTQSRTYSCVKSVTLYPMRQVSWFLLHPLLQCNGTPPSNGWHTHTLFRTSWGQVLAQGPSTSVEMLRGLPQSH